MQVGARQDFPYAAPALMGSVWMWKGVQLDGSPGGQELRFPVPRPVGILPASSSPTVLPEYPGHRAGKGELLGGFWVQERPPHYSTSLWGSESWNWQHLVDQSQSLGPKKVQGTADLLACGVRPRERLGALGAPTARLPPGSPIYAAWW